LPVVFLRHRHPDATLTWSAPEAFFDGRRGLTAPSAAGAARSRAPPTP